MTYVLTNDIPEIDYLHIDFTVVLKKNDRYVLNF